MDGNTETELMNLCAASDDNFAEMTTFLVQWMLLDALNNIYFCWTFGHTKQQSIALTHWGLVSGNGR